MNYKPVCTAVIDIGSPAQDRLGWFLLPERAGGSSMEELAQKIASYLRKGSCALGFEAPMYVPYRAQANELLKGRPIEGNRAWSASAGTTVLAMSLAVVPFFLRLLREAAPWAKAHFNCDAITREPGELFLFEALVSGNSKGIDHQDDARIAAEYFEKLCPQWPPESQTKESVFSLLGASMLRTGWSDDLRLLSRSCLVLKP
jgi:hypothetical protein